MLKQEIIDNHSDEVCPDVEYQTKVGASDTTESAVDDTEAGRDRNAKKVIIRPVTDSNKEKAICEKEIIQIRRKLFWKKKSSKMLKKGPAKSQPARPSPTFAYCTVGLVLKHPVY